MHAAAARAGLAVAYPLLAFWAGRAGSGAAAAIALADLALVLLVEPLLRARAWGWAVFTAVLLGLRALLDTGTLQLLLLAPPVLFVGLLAWFFGRSLRAPREALITRIVAGLDRCEPRQLPAALYRYTRRLTGGWALLLAVLALVNGALALLAVPDGVLARLGHPPAWGVPRAWWSLIANLLNYGVVGGFFVGEYLVRRRRFPHRPYRSFVEFLQQLARLGPAFWRGVFR